MTPEAITLVLELRVAGDCLTGSATDTSGERREFAGWLGLVGVLDGFVGTGTAEPACADDAAPA
jgi:hypothetical protein